jgi:hypothetical protein
MSSKQKAGKRNLLILAWMGLACQVIGVAGTLLSFAARAGLPIPVPDNPLPFVFLLPLGMALAGWVGNFREIVDIKERISALEGRTASNGDVPHEAARIRETIRNRC